MLSDSLSKRYHETRRAGASWLARSLLSTHSCGWCLSWTGWLVADPAFCGELSSHPKHFLGTYFQAFLGINQICASAQFFFIDSLITETLQFIAVFSEGVAQAQISRFTVICFLISCCSHWKTPACLKMRWVNVQCRIGNCAPFSRQSPRTSLTTYYFTVRGSQEEEEERFEFCVLILYMESVETIW